MVCESLGKSLEWIPDDARILIVGDVHGCLDELNLLLEKFAFQPGKDILLCLGDLIGKGPDSKGVLDRVMELKGISVQGNHEMCYLRWVQKLNPLRKVNIPGEIPKPLNPEGGEHKILAE
eukprot:Sdes_comp12690_c0_seq1m2999